MADQPNFLLGFGERLTEPVPPPRRKFEDKSPYDPLEARDRLAPLVESAADEFDSLPASACPADEAVAIVTLHPQALAKTKYPGRLLREVGLEAVGSRPSRVRPEKWTRVGAPEEDESTDLFVAGPRSGFRAWAESIKGWGEFEPAIQDLPKVETLRAARAADRLRPIPSDEDHPLLEVALHAGPQSDYILEAFLAYADELGMVPDADRRLYVGELCFMPVRGVRARMNELGQFSFLRVARGMPSLRPLNPVIRSTNRPTPFACQLPDSEPVDPDLRAAVFDGGVLPTGSTSRWVDLKEGEGVGSPIPLYVEHGASVTSALLFGPLREGESVDRPFGRLDHYRVLDKDSGRDEDLYDVLIRIRNVLQSSTYQFVNLSIGPEIPIEDDEVHGWTAVLDDLFDSGDALVTVSAGNGGERDAQLRFNRVQVPSDCMNVFTVGSADRSGNTWARAPYSSVGPGRSPGLVKPEALAFGGSELEPFWVVSAGNPTLTVDVQGTSFASPAALRLGMGIRAHFGERLTPLAIKALLIHCADDAIGRPEGGWGRVPGDIESFVICPDGAARIVYQGELSPAQYLRAQIPLPEEQLEGNVEIAATICYATPTDANHPGNYTCAGVDVVFRPHDERFSKDSEDPTSPATDSFFKLKEFSTEQELRRDAHKWETTLHACRTKRGSSLHNPTFDIHYNAREGGASTKAAEKIHYAIVITVSSKRVKDLYNRIVRRYPTQLQPLLPLVQIPIQTRS